MTEISPYFHGLDERSPLQRQMHAASQRDAWLRQMEFALLSEMNQANEFRKASNGQDKSRHGAYMAVSRHADPGAPQPVRPPSSDTNDSQALQEAGTPSHGTTPLANPHAEQDRATVLSAGKSMVPQALDAATMAATGIAIASLRETQVSTGQQDSGASPAQTALNRAFLSPGLLEKTLDSDIRDAASPIGESTQQDSPLDGLPADEMPVWQKRLMHVTSDGQNVDVWIRDSELSQIQSQNVVSRLASEFAETGMRLKSATVNGKLEYRSEGEATQAARHFKADVNDPSPDSRYSTITTMREDHAA